MMERGFFSFLGKFIPGISKISVDVLKLKVLEKYSAAVAELREITLKTFGALVLIVLLFSGLGFAFLGGLFLLPISLEAKLWVLFGVGLFLSAVCLSIFCFFFSEKFWIKASHIPEKLEELDPQSPKNDLIEMKIKRAHAK